ncbi:MAG: glycosyltransferase family 39 protein [Polyangiaceae bacterium]|nr:glycosyltransferase family 39 protein [Polyangiaceae bacterium]
MTPEATQAPTSKARQRRWLALVGVALVVLVGVGLRCIHLRDPFIADFHSWRQADSAGFAHGYLIETLNPFSPRASRQPCEVADAPFGLVEAELPISAWLSAVPLRLLGVSFPPPWYLRSVSIVFFVLTAFYLYRLQRLLGANRFESGSSLLVFATLPLAIFFNRTPQPDGPALAFCVAFLYHLERWLTWPTEALPDSKRWWQHRDVQLGLSALWGGGMLMIKAPNLFMGLPALYLVLSARGAARAVREWRLWLWGVCVLALGSTWYWHAHQFPWTFGVWGDRAETKFSSWALFNSQGPWRTLSERVVSSIAGWGALALALLGLGAGLEERRTRLYVVWLVGFVCFVAAVLKGNVTHVYYQLPAVLPLSLLAGRGMTKLWDSAAPQANSMRVPAQRWGNRTLLIALLALHGWNTQSILFAETKRGEHRGFYHTDNDIIATASLLKQHLPPGARFVSVDRNPAFFYNSEHQGFFTERTGLSQVLSCAKGRADYALVPITYQNQERLLSGRVKRVGQTSRYLLWQFTSAAPKQAP